MALIKPLKSSFFIQSPDHLENTSNIISKHRHSDSIKYFSASHLKYFLGIEVLVSVILSDYGPWFPVPVPIIIIRIQSTSEYHHLPSSPHRYLCRFYLHHHPRHFKPDQLSFLKMINELRSAQEIHR